MERIILEKIKKLLALAQSSNEHEAALAAGRAQELIDLHKLSVTEVDGRLFEADNPVDEDVLSPDFDAGHYKLRFRGWKVQLLSELSRLNSCQLLFANWVLREGKRVWLPKRSLTIVGRQADRQVVEYLASYLMRQIEQLAKTAFENAHGTSGCRDLRGWTASFGRGAMQTVVNRMKNDRRRSTEAQPEMRAVVLRDDTALSNYMLKYQPKLGHQNTQSSSRLDSGVYFDGRNAGSGIQWHSAVGAAKGTGKQMRLLANSGQ